jgi:carboxyl-terminal processing protease
MGEISEKIRAKAQWRHLLIRSFKMLFTTVLVLALAWASYAGGQRLRHLAVNLGQRVRLSGLPIGSSSVALAAEDSDTSDPAETFQEVLRYVKSEYVDRINNDSKLGFGAVKTMLLSLDDPKTRFYDPKQREQLMSELNGDYTGIGATLTVIKQKKGDIDERRLAVVAPEPGSPAEKAGIQPGDVITDIDKHWVIAYDPRLDLNKLHTVNYEDKAYRDAWKEATRKLTDGISLQKALDQLNGPDGKTLNLTVERSGVKTPLKFSIVTSQTNVSPVDFHEINPDVAYMRINQFNDASISTIHDDLANLKQKELILDLRNNSGGPVISSQTGAMSAMMNLLSSLHVSGQIGTLVKKGDVRENLDVKAQPGDPLKIAVLINHGTANLAELTAAALKEKVGANLIGEDSFGDSVYQKLIPLQDGAAMTIRAGKLLAPQGLDFTGKGLKPDMIVHEDTVVGSGDKTVQAAVDKLTGA